MAVRKDIIQLSYMLLLSFVLLVGCNKPKVEQKKLGMNIDSAYMMLTRDVEMLVSDSGLTKYRLSSPLWIVYDREDKKEWLFPHKLRMWSVDSLKPGHRLVSADSVIFKVPEEEWILIGNVKIDGLKGEKLYTKRLHWLRREKRMYSNDTTYFYTEGKELHGDRFEAKDDLSQYTIYRSRGEFEVPKQMLDASPSAPAAPPAASVTATPPTNTQVTPTPTTTATAPRAK